MRRIAEYCQGFLPGGQLTGRRSRRLARVGEPSIYEGKPIFPWDDEELSSVERLEKDLIELRRYWERYGRKGQPYIAVAPISCQLTDKRAAVAEDVAKGAIREGEVAYVSHYPVLSTDQVVAGLRAHSDIGVDHVGILLASFSFAGRKNVDNLLHQMDLLAAHVLPKLPKDESAVGPFSYPEETP